MALQTQMATTSNNEVV